MYKNQLQELAQRSCFNLPSYSCIREGPDHAPRFKATVNFNGEVFESPGYHTTLRHAEHAAAEVALNTLSRRGPTQSLAARILDETGVCKNLLQETAQRAGVSLPVYTTIRSGPKHVPLFKCMVEVGSRNFIGEPAKTKKQAEKNAAMAAWSSLKQLTSASHMPLLLESPEGDEVGDRINGGPYYGRDERATLQNSPSQMQFAAQTRVRMVNVRDRNRLSRDVNATGGQFYSGAPSTVVADAASSDRNCSRYIFNHQPVASPGEVSYEAGQRYLYNQSSISGSSHLPPDVSFDTLGHGHGGRVFYNPKATPSSSGGSSSRRQAGRHQRRHSLSGMESPMLSREAMAVSRASGGGNMLGRVMLHQQQQQIRGLPYQSLSERFDLNRPSLLEELQQRDEEDEWLRGEVMSSSARPQQHSIHCFPLQSQSERFEFKNRHLPQLEEVHCRDEEEWLHGESLGSINSLDREKSVDHKHGYREGWLRGETLMQSLEEQKNHGYREGWLRGEILKHSLEEEKRHGYREGWLCNEALKHNLEENKSLSQNHIHNYNHIHSHGHGYKDGWPHRETPGNNTEERSHTHGHVYLKDVQGEKKTVYGVAATAADSSSSSASPPSSPFSSLWSRSTQWWGSRMPASTSSAAAALASTLGLRPASSMAPAVRVRQMVPVCSAAPPRRTDAQAPSRLPLNDPSSSMVDGEAGAHQLFNKLRL